MEISRRHRGQQPRQERRQRGAERSRHSGRGGRVHSGVNIDGQSTMTRPPRDTMLSAIRVMLLEFILIEVVSRKVN